MLVSLVAAALCAAPGPCPPEVATELWQVAPDAGGKPWAAPEAPSDKARAVVLVPGLFVHPARPVKATQPDRRPWQNPKSELVTALAPDADVFAFGYAQTVAVDEVAQSPGLRDAVARLRRAGYKEVVLIGHSAGGVIVRQFAERYPDAGVTKVIAVAAPFAGVELATVKVGYPKVQAPFIHSLAPEARTAATRANPPGRDVPLACVVCKLKLLATDGLVPARSQWPDDLQQAGVPAAHAPVSHFDVMKNADAVKAIAKLTREKLTRWSPEETEQARKVLFGEAKK
ncbi:MAG: alpha/beta fold hydrolase [Planctomycetes bacterium]|nr:alpha/beta fold hydrolase [Planctomycetota bacterium]